MSPATKHAESRTELIAHLATRVLLVTGALVIRTAAAVAFTVLAMAEVFIVPLVSFLAFALFFVVVLFGFVLGMHFPERWEALGASVILLWLTFAYRALMSLLLWVARTPLR